MAHFIKYRSIVFSFETYTWTCESCDTICKAAKCHSIQPEDYEFLESMIINGEEIPMRMEPGMYNKTRDYAIHIENMVREHLRISFTRD
jgi:hypothetical protein